MVDKTQQLLCFLRDVAKIRRKRVWAYGEQDRVFWISQFPADEPECDSPFHDTDTANSSSWLTIKKPNIPPLPVPPEGTLEWVEGGEDQLNHFKADPPELRAEITTLSQVPTEPLNDSVHAGASSDTSTARTILLTECPEIEDRWTEYVVEEWLPWAAEMQRLDSVRSAYEALDTMRRRLEEAAESFELIVAVGHLQWQDNQGKSVGRHLITAPAEIDFVADRGTISIVPAASFDSCHLELDMLDPPDQPAVDHNAFDEKLGELGIELWASEGVGKLLSEIANHHGVNSRVCLETLAKQPQTTDQFCISFAPAVVLRKRRLIAYDDLVRDFLANEEELPTTRPWDVLVGGDESGGGPASDNGGPPAVSTENDRYLPLATNEEQEKIIDRLEQTSAVVVKGPPGTGKSHTIANLMCHLLARGERILVTAQAPKALSVLLDKLPNEIGELCVSALASSKQDLELLKKSVAGILHRWNNWDGLEEDEKAIEEFELQRTTIQGELQKTLRAMREVREAESHNHTLPGGFEGTAAHIARQLESTATDFEWLEGVPKLHHTFPLSVEQLTELADTNAELNDERQAELDCDLGRDGSPRPEEFAQTVEHYRAAILRREQVCRHSQVTGLSDIDLSPLELAELEGLGSELRELNNCITVAGRVFPTVVQKTVEDLLAGRTDFYLQLISQADAGTRELDGLLEKIGGTQIEISDESSLSSLQTDAKRRADHFRAGGRRGFWLFKPDVVRKTDYIEKRCRIDGKPARDLPGLETLLAYLGVQSGLDRLSEMWPGASEGSSAIPHNRLDEFKEVYDALKRLANVVQSGLEHICRLIPLETRIMLADSPVRSEFQHAVDIARAQLDEKNIKQVILRWLREARPSAEDQAPHRVMDALRDAISKCKPAEYAAAYAERAALLEAKRRRDLCLAWYSELDAICPGVGQQLKQWQGDSLQRQRIDSLPKAFRWAAAHQWLQERTSQSTWVELANRARTETEKLQQTVELLAARRAWALFFQRMQASPKVLRDIRAWRQAQQRIGRGTGAYAFRHRQEARDYLMRCVTEMPAWIMPLHKVWENASANPGLFDTVIIDEASQAGVDSVLLLLLAKRIIVVGDDKQNSPEGVGVREDDLATLVRQHLQDFPYGRTFRHDSSLFDHAERDFANLISLREHFRCVPEIIRFSNDQFYTDAPLIPLRQRLPESLPPLQTTFVEIGFAEGDNRRIRNRAEAEAIVECIQQCLQVEQYIGKTMGVIALQGHSQAELIEGMLRDRVDPKTIEDVRLRCGDSATFQGDQRDVMFLSMVVAPNKNYTARTTLADQRRYNVAMSRARDQVWLFHSVAIGDLSRECLRNQLLRYMHGATTPEVAEDFQDLEWLERQARMPRRHGEQPPPFDSWFEVDVALELLRRRYRLRPQYEVLGRPRYRIDIVIEGFEGRLAVECDGDYHLEPEQIEKDLERQRQLERADWEFVRIPESEFYTNRQAAIRRVEEKCVELGIMPYRSYDTSDHDGSSPGAAVTDEDQLEAGDSTDSQDPEDNSTEYDSTEEAHDSGQPFTGYSEECGFPDPREATTTNIRQVLLEIIERDGPLSYSSIIRLYRQGCPAFGRAARVVRSEIRKALGVMKRMKQVEMEVELEDDSEDGRIYRLSNTPRVRERAAGARKMEEIPPSEIASILKRHEGTLDGIKESWCVVQEVYGFQRLTAPRRQYLEKVIRAASQTRFS